MAQPYLGEIRMFAGNFAPAGWAFCEGQLLAISENTALFQLIGTTYGGDGESTFALPDLRGRVPIHQGTNDGTTFILAENGGVESVTLTVNRIPAHTHSMQGTIDAASSAAPGNSFVFARALAAMITPYAFDSPSTPMSPQMVGAVGGSQPHTNFQPYLCVDFIISLFGIFPSQT